MFHIISVLSQSGWVDRSPVANMSYLCVWTLRSSTQVLIHPARNNPAKSQMDCWKATGTQDQTSSDWCVCVCVALQSAKASWGQWQVMSISQPTLLTCHCCVGMSVCVHVQCVYACAVCLCMCSVCVCFGSHQANPGCHECWHSTLCLYKADHLAVFFLQYVSVLFMTLNAQQCVYVPVCLFPFEGCS